MKWPDLWNSPHQAGLAQQEWTAALDVVDISIFLHDAQFRILRCNRAYQRSAGIPFQQIIGRPYYEVFPKIGAPLPCCLRVMEKRVSAENTACEEDVVVGEAIYRSRVFSAHDRQGAYLYSVHILEDVTERRHAELALHDSEARFRQMAEMIDDALWMASPDAQSILYISHAFETLWGRPCADLYARPQLWLEMVHPDDAPRVRQALDALAQGAAYNIDFRILRPDGTERWINDRGYALRDGSGHVTLISGISLDITERKLLGESLRESEARYALTVSNAQLATWDWNIKTGHDIFNERWAEMRGYRLEEIEPHVSSWEKGVNPDDLSAMRAILEEHFKGHTPFFQAEYRVRTQSGTDIWILDRGTVSERDAEGNPLHMMGIEIDITERKQAEAKIAEQLDELKRWNKIMERRELRVMELKREVNALLAQAGQPPRYPSVVEPGETMG